jgi:hypothetical protein
MKKLILSTLLSLSLAGAPVLAAADHTVFFYKDEVVTILLEDRACTDRRILDNLLPEFHAQFKGGRVLFEGKQFQLCWTLQDIERGVVWILDEEGSVVPLDASKLKRGRAV